MNKAETSYADLINYWGNNRPAIFRNRWRLAYRWELTKLHNRGVITTDQIAEAIEIIER